MRYDGYRGGGQEGGPELVHGLGVRLGHRLEDLEEGEAYSGGFEPEAAMQEKV